jgi:hypothetical protein
MTWIATGQTDPNAPFLDVSSFVRPAPQTPDNGAATTVANQWVAMQNFATSAFTGAQTFITTLQNIRFGGLSIDPHLQTLDLNIAAFDQLLGTAPSVPANSFAYTEIPYSDQLLTDLRAALLSWVDGKATGILPSVEQAIYDRGRAREVVVSNRKAAEAVRQYAMRGFQKPPGALSLEIQDAMQEAQNTSVTLNRDIIIKQAELEQTNRRFSFEQSWKMEEGMIAYTNQQMQRALDKAKILQQFIIDIFQQQVAEYGVQGQIYGARVGAEVNAFNAKTNMQVAEANVRMEAARLQLQTYIQEVTLVVESLKAGATVSAQLAASALSAMNVQASVQDHTQTSSSNQSSVQGSVADHQTTSLGLNYSYSGAA